jgi:hypothetical protein
VGLHAARRVNGVAPEVVDEFAPADHSCHHRPCVDPDPDREPAQAGSLGDRRDLVPHCKRQAGDRLEVVGPWLWQPAGHHVGLADRFDLLDTRCIGEPVERGEIWSRRATSSSAAMINDRSVKPTMSAKSTLTVS